jgi:hypothetical protein
MDPCLKMVLLRACKVGFSVASPQPWHLGGQVTDNPVFQAPRTLSKNCDLMPRRSTLGGMAIRRIQIDYTVYSPNYRPGVGVCLDFRNLQRAKSRARGLGAGARVYRNFNQKNKKGQILGDWWSCDRYWLWDGATFKRLPISSPVTG